MLFRFIVTEALILKTSAGQSTPIAIIYEENIVWFQQESNNDSNQLIASFCWLTVDPGEWHRPQCPPRESEPDTGSVSLNEQDKQLTFDKPHTLKYTFEDYIYKVCGLWELKHLPEKGKFKTLK